ncbi:MAG: BON domain-containing protein [bacterium]
MIRLNGFLFIAFIAALMGVLLLPVSGCGVAKDTKIQVAIRQELEKHRDVQSDKLIINVKNGVATISGELYTREEIDKVVEVASAVEGVVEVVNRMSLPDNYNSVNPTFLDPFN